MELQFAFFCDEATEDPTGKMDVRGVFHDLYAPGFPAVQETMTLVLVIEWDRKDQGQFGLKAELVSPEGQVMLTVDGHSEVDLRPAPAAPARTRLIMPLEKVAFPRPGRYHLRIIVKGQRFRGPSLHLMETASPNESPDSAALTGDGPGPEAPDGPTPQAPDSSEPGEGPTTSIRLPQV